MAAVFGPQAYWFDAVPEGLVIPLADGKEHLFDYDDGPEIVLPDRRLPTRTAVLSDTPPALGRLGRPVGGGRGRKDAGRPRHSGLDGPAGGRGG